MGVAVRQGRPGREHRHKSIGEAGMTHPRFWRPAGQGSSGARREAVWDAWGDGRQGNPVKTMEQELAVAASFDLDDGPSSHMVPPPIWTREARDLSESTVRG